MARVIERPLPRKRKTLIQVKCKRCRCTVRFYRDDRHWTEHGNTYGRCPNCDEILFLGRFELPDTY